MPPWQRTKPSAGPSAAEAQKIQHAFTNSRLVDINQGTNQDFLKRIVKQQLARELRMKPDAPALEQRYQLFTRTLQNAQLVINFKAPGWFASQAGFDDYKTMYEFAPTLKGNAQNPVLWRAQADDKVTLPPSMKGGKFEKAMSPGKMMLTPGHQRVADANEKRYYPSNPQFNAKTKQVFAALNYGRRPHGGCVDYGYSFFTVSNDFKTNAIYFAGDTFSSLMPAGGGKYAENPTSGTVAINQLSYDTVAGLILHASPRLRADILKTCLFAGSLDDTVAPDLLVEAHLFEHLTMKGGVTSAWISGRDVPAADLLADPNLWKKICHNAAVWGARNSVRVHFWDEP